MAWTLNNSKDLSISVIREAQIWIERNISAPISIDCLVVRSGYSRWHFQRVFKEVTGISVARYVRMRRVTIAAWFLKTTVLSVSEIYPRIGVEDHSIFCRIFKSHFGVSPEKYRVNHQDFEHKEFHPTIADNAQ